MTPATKIENRRARAAAKEFLRSHGQPIPADATAIANAIASVMGDSAFRTPGPAKAFLRRQFLRSPPKSPRESAPAAASDAFLLTPEWRRLRYDALRLHGARCQCCGASAATGAVINVDHIFPRKTHPHLALTLSNLQVLCADCNAGKGNRDTTDWRGNGQPKDPGAVTRRSAVPLEPVPGWGQQAHSEAPLSTRMKKSPALVSPSTRRPERYARSDPTVR